ncbi:MAG: TetR/AcrR family transcriptional regulator [Actinobacteria bacterium]|nr:TetR/AcrR family transcriptional regulator [Actinomycetota bacterium]
MVTLTKPQPPDGGTGESNVGSTQRDPLTERGRRTRESLLVAARKVFEDKGYPDTRISDIAVEAGVAHGTVYTYFEDKAAVFQAVVYELTAQLDREWRIGQEQTDPVERISEANRRYLDSYTTHSRLLEVVEQVGTSDPQYRQLLTDFRQRYVERAVAGIRRLQRDGTVDTALDPYLAGSALCAMVEGFGRQWLVRRERHDPHVVSDTLTRLWASALGLPVPAVATSGTQPATQPTAQPAAQPQQRSTS